MIKKGMLRKILLSIATVVILLYFLSPLIALFLASIHTEAELYSVPPHWIPWNPTSLNYLSFINLEAREKLPLFPPYLEHFVLAFKNTIIVAFSVAFISLAIGSPCAYTMARIRGRGGDYLTIAVLATRMLPLPAIIIPLYIFLRSIHMLDNILGLVWVYVGLFTPYVIWMLKGFFVSFPAELEESAMLDGCSKFGAFLRIVLPLAIPSMTAVGVIIFLFSWNLFIIPLILTSEKAVVLPVIVGLSQQEGLLSFSLMSAIGVVCALPTLLLAILLHKYIISGLLGGALKG